MALICFAVLGGCAETGSRFPNEAYDLSIGGAHYLWIDESTIEAEAYLIHTGAGASYSYLDVNGILISDTADATIHQRLPRDLDWESGEVHKWSARWENVTRRAYRLDIDVAHGDVWQYKGKCLLPDGSPSDACRSAAPTPRLSAANERATLEEFLRCCGWRPLPLDIHSMTCTREVGTITCAAKLVNWRGDPAEVSGEAILWLDEEEVTRRALDLPALVGEGEILDIRVTFELTPLDQLAAGAAFQVEMRVVDRELPASFVNESAEVPSVLGSEQSLTTQSMTCLLCMEAR